MAQKGHLRAVSLVHSGDLVADGWRLSFTMRLMPRQGTFRIVGQVGPTGRHHVQLEIGCRGPHLVSSLLEAFVDDHAGRHPDVRLSATLQVDDSMRPRRVDVLVPSGAISQVRALPGMLELAAAPPG